jgi:hypothetical protein
VKAAAFVLAVLALGTSACGGSRSRARADPHFVPEGGRPAGAWFAPATATLPAQVLVASGPSRARLVLWQLDSRGHWQRVWSALQPPQFEVVEVFTGDATGDGHADFVVGWTRGSGDCGPRFLLGIVGGRLRRIPLTGANTCDTQFRPQRGHLVVSAGWYTPHDSHCCPTFTRETTLRWDGRRFARVHARLYWNCIDTFCEHWPRRPLRFVPSRTAFWDSRRGLAVGGRRPWLLGWTSDGGRTWHIADAAACAVAPPRITAAGRAEVKFVRCDGRYDARTRDFGKTWSIRGPAP